jgi:ribosomal-protein-alanine N-acetyltransferase
MSALPDLLPRFRPMQEPDLDHVMQIEPLIYTHPWTRGNFLDSLRAGYSCWVIECGRQFAGYAVLMIGVHEAHLLNLSIAPDWQGKGYGRALLLHLVGLARDSDAAHMFLEVRPSNVAARRLYAAHGFQEITVRRGYYPSGPVREDAILMGLAL